MDIAAAGKLRGVGHAPLRCEFGVGAVEFGVGLVADPLTDVTADGGKGLQQGSDGSRQGVYGEQISPAAPGMYRHRIGDNAFAVQGPANW